MQLNEGLTDTVRRLSISLSTFVHKGTFHKSDTQPIGTISSLLINDHKRGNTSALQPVQILNRLRGLVQTFYSVKNKWRLDTYHFTVFKDQQDGDGLDTLSQALEDVWVLQDSGKK